MTALDRFTEQDKADFRLMGEHGDLMKQALATLKDPSRENVVRHIRRSLAKQAAAVPPAERGPGFPAEMVPIFKELFGVDIVTGDEPTGPPPSKPGKPPRPPRRPSNRIQWKGPDGVLVKAKAIVESYQTGVTLRQLFYRLVAAGLITNKQTTYNTLSHLTAQARRAGWFPTLIDQGRSIDQVQSWESPEDALTWMAGRYRLDRTEGQSHAVYIAVEKGALSGLLWDWFGDRGLPVFALRGYTSQTFADDVVSSVHDDGRPSVLIYGGDFDPSGQDIMRDFVERAACFDTIKHVALTEQQVIDYDLPPDPGKASDPRASQFFAKYGRLVQVELDALPPDTLHQLYEDALAPYWDQAAYDDVCRREQAGLAALVRVAGALDEDDEDADE
jgi:hypothetical protein